ncbi:MAG: FAD-binding oxidoreductase [Chloroflexaceae bacterium]
MLPVSLTRQLTEIVGPDRLTEETTPFAVHGRAPALVITPTTVEDLAGAVAACHAARVPLVPWGGGTRQRWGRPIAAETFVVLRTTGLRSILMHEPDDLTISIEAGMTFAALDAALAEHNQMLPLDPPRPDQSTIGGLLASGADGPRRLAYGTSRDLLIGIRVVEATGRVSKAGGMVVKNVSGFDMMKLYLGSLGTLAIIVSANFKLIPRPRAAASLSCFFEPPERAFRLIKALSASQLTPVAVEYREDGPAASIEVRIEGLPAAVERHVRDLRRMAEEAGASAVSLSAEEPATVEQRWVSFNDAPQTVDLAADELVARLSCLPAALETALGDARALAARAELSLRVQAHALSGVAYLRLRGSDEGLRAWHAALLARWPHLVVIGAQPALAAELPVWGAALANLDLMRRIKQEFDPESLLNPGRYVV